MLTGLANYKLLFMVQLILGEGIFLFRLQLRPSALQRVFFCVIVLLGIAVVFPILGYNAWYLSLMFLSLFLCTLAAAALCIDEPFQNILFCGFAGYTVQHLSYLLYTFFNDATRFDQAFGNIIDPYGSGPINIGDLWILQLVFYVDIYFLIYTGAFELFDRLLLRNHNLHLGRTSMVALSGLLILTNVVSNMITTYYTTDNRISLLLEHSYNILLCLLVLALLYSQLSQKDLREQLSGMQYILEQGKKQYELAKHTTELINIKYHDLRHQSQLFSSRAERQELDQVLDDYAVLVHTGNEVLDVLLTEKTILCRERGIQLLCMADGSHLDFIEPHHLYALLGNGINNAMEAVQKLPPEERVISLYIRAQGNLVHIHMENPYEGTVAMRNGLPVTSKGDQNYHGYGTLSIRTIAEQYGGGMTINTEDGLFQVDIVLCANAGQGAD